MTRRSRIARLAAAAATTLVTLAAGVASAAPAGHILRIDPRAGVSGGKPVLTSVFEIVQFKQLADVLAPCAGMASYEKAMSCWSTQLEAPRALWSPIPFPTDHVNLLVNVSGSDVPMSFVDETPWGKAKAQPNVGTAWLIALDASSGMGSHYTDAEQVAHAFLDKMDPNDLVDLMVFDDRATIANSKWKTYKDRNAIVQLLQAQHVEAGHPGNSRALFNQIKSMTTDAFGSLGNTDAPDAVPMHQAMVVLSDGAGRNDTESVSASADVFHQYLDAGRFDSNNALPKTPLPVVSVWFPETGGGMVGDLYKNNDAQFMQALANPEIGGFFDVVQAGGGAAKGPKIVAAVKERFDAMFVTHWQLACLNPTVTQTFNLVFQDTKPMIAPDGSFKDVPLGVDPTQWPLDVDFDKTSKEAQANPLYPGGTFKVFGTFCWGGDKGRAEAYFIPAGTSPSAATNSKNLNAAKQAMQQLIAENMRGSAVDVGDTFATFNVPDDPKVLDGTGDNMVARVVLYDNTAHRASAVDQKTVLSLHATKKPLPWLIILAIGLGAVAILLLVMVVFRGGGGGKPKRGGGGPPGPVGPQGYGPPPMGGAPPYGGGGVPPYGGGGPQPPGYNMAPALGAVGVGVGAAALAAPALPQLGYVAPANATPQPAAAPLGAQSPTSQVSVVQVTCPACAMKTMATPGQPSVCFSCGQPLPADIAVGGGAVSAPTFPLTGAMSASAPTPPPSPYAVAASAATIRGASGQFTILPGSEVRVGRDPAQCPIFLAEPRVSGVHSTLKLEGSQLWVRDEVSNNGTWVAGARIPPGTWSAVPAGAQLRFGPIEFSVQLEA
jgi:hypothetical protein